MLHKYRALGWTLAFLIIAQFALPWVVPQGWVYNQRMVYDAVKNNPGPDVDVTIDQIARDIKQRGVTEYNIILGDSVAYSGPGGPEQSLAVRFNELAAAGGNNTVTYNLAMPATHLADVYTMLLKLKEHGLAPKRILIDVLYAEFVQADDITRHYWLTNDLARLDPMAYAHAFGQPRVSLTKPLDLSAFFRQHAYPYIPLLRYHDFLYYKIGTALGLLVGEQGDPRVWSDKPGLPQIMQQRIYQYMFDDKPFVMDESNQGVYFVDRILAATEPGQVVFYLAPVNQALMRDNVDRSGYQANLDTIRQFFASKPAATFVDYESAFSQSLFADHVHLIADGYRKLAASLWPYLQATGSDQQGRP